MRYSTVLHTVLDILPGNHRLLWSFSHPYRSEKIITPRQNLIFKIGT